MALFILPFDHRAGLASELFGYAYPALGRKERAHLTQAKEIIFNGFRKALPAVPKGEGIILVDDEFGGHIVAQARKEKIPVALTVEQSGAPIFEFVHGDSFGDVLAKAKPTYAKALVHYVVGNETINRVQRTRLRQLSDWCRAHQLPLLLEPLLGKDQPTGKLMIQMIEELHLAGVRPALWKVEGLRTTAEWKVVRKAAGSPIVVLGRASKASVVKQWLTVAAASGEVEGFAVGRTIFMQPLKQFYAKKISRATAEEHIAKRFLGYVHLWQKVSSKRT